MPERITIKINIFCANNQRIGKYFEMIQLHWKNTQHDNWKKIDTIFSHLESLKASENGLSLLPV